MSSEGDFYLDAWLCPAERKDGTYTQYTVLVDNQIAGTITPTIGGFQSISLDNGQTLSLNAGRNTIIFQTEGIEVPNVEKIYINEYLNASSSDTNAYEEYVSLAAATNGIVEEENVTVSPTVSGTAPPMIILNMPLKYSSYKRVSLSEGDSLIVSTTSSVEHVIDVFYLTPLLTISPLTQSTINSIAAESSEQDSDTTTLSDGTLFPFNPVKPIMFASGSDKTLGINYKGISEVSLTDSTTNEAKVNIWSAPFDGYYMVSFRSMTNGVLGTVDISINGELKYENEPIYCARQNANQRVDTLLGTYTICADSDEDDPMLFIEGADAGRVVAFNDDCARAKRTLYGLSTYDSFVNQTYNVKATGLRVSNYSSSNPESTCTIIVGVTETDSVSTTSIDSISNNINQVSRLSALKSSPDIRIAVGEECLLIESTHDIRTVSTYTISGMKCGQCNAVSSQSGRCEIPLSAIGLKRKDTFIVLVGMDDGYFVDKVLMR